MLSMYMNNDLKIDNYDTFNDELLYVDRLDLKTKFNVTLIEPHMALKYEGNFYGLLKEIGTPISLYLQALYINRLTHPTDYRSSMLVVKTPVKLKIPEQ